MKNNTQNEPLTFGFDIGIASVGWAVLSPTRIVDMGVRCFDKAETADRGESLNLARRQARLMRRRLYHRAWRLMKVAKTLKREGLIDNIKVLKQQPEKGFKTPNLWQLRVKALDSKLNSEEWARVIYHICKHRGFHWTSKAEEKNADKDTEGGAVKKGLSGTKKLMHEKQYRTTAEMVINEFPDSQRNKRGEYSKALSRELLANELNQLFECQRQLGNEHASPSLELIIVGSGDKRSGLLWQQKPALSGEALLKMLGKCTFEKSEYRAPKASFSAERHVWLTRLNNLRIVVDGQIRALTQAEHAIALPLPYLQAGDFTYKQFRKALEKIGLVQSFRFAGLSYPSDRQKQEDKAKDPEDQALVKLPSWQKLRSTLKEYDLENEWKKLSSDALDGNPILLDKIATVLSVYKEDDEVLCELGKLDLPNKEKLNNALSYIRFDKFSNLSLKALYKILPYMEQGLRYDEACEKADYHHSKLHDIGKGESKYLPPFYSSRDKTGKMLFNEELDVPRNPVVLRALNQARKVCNALIHKHGSPHEIHIEMARDLSKPYDERKKIKDEQEKYSERNRNDRRAFDAEYNTSGTLKGREFEKWRLYREQQGKCAYSLEALDINRLFEQGYAEVDHALPYSRSYDDSKNNKALVLSRENRNKGNMTPFEYLDGKEDSERWRMFVAFVESNKMYRQAKRNRLLKRDFGSEESKDFVERNLNDTRYICKFFKNFVERHLKLHDESDTRRCVVLSGQLTSFLRARWDLVKSRGESDRHHALDAVVVAACTHSMVKRLSDYSRRKELSQVREGFVDVGTGEIVNKAMFDQLEAHFPNPWIHFRQELEARLVTDDAGKLRSILQTFGTYSEPELTAVRPLFVSRAPQRRNGGAAHKATVYAKPTLGQRLTLQDKKTKSIRTATEKELSTLAVERIGVTDKDQKGNYKFTLAKLEDVVDPERNARLIHSLRLWLTDRDQHDKGIKSIESSLGRGKDKREMTEQEQTTVEKLRALPRMPCKGDPDDGPFTGPVIRTVKLNAGKTSGIPIRGGVATNDSMLRVDIFRNQKDGKYHLVPLYTHHRVAKELPNRAIVAFKDEPEWTLIDENFDFLFSLFPNDFIRVQQKGKIVLSGYYSSCHRGTGNINFWAHDRNIKTGKEGMIEGVGVKTALSLEKFNVDVLGNIYPAPREKRRDLA